MNWVDIVMILLVVLVTFGGVRRGFVLEISDILILILGTTVTVHLYRYLARFAMHTFHWPVNMANIVSYFVIFIPIAIIIYVIALMIDKFARVPGLKTVNEVVGGIIAFPKSLILAWLLLILLAIAVPDARDAIQTSPTAKVIQSTSAVFEGILSAVSPPEVYEDFKNAIENLKKKPLKKHGSRTGVPASQEVVGNYKKFVDKLIISNNSGG
ncbi:MAG: CvpA family protein [Firmicutes bacterium]|nr:CvpA family protein [Bacillota bacterium]